MRSEVEKSRLSLLHFRLFPDALKSPVYRYLVNYTPSKAADSSTLLPYPSRFSFHMMDSLAFFGGLEMALGTTTSKDIEFQQTLTKYFIHFAKEGEHHLLLEKFPTNSAIQYYHFKKCSKNKSGLFSDLAGKMPEDWPEFPSKTAVLNQTLSVPQNILAERCDLWENNNFYSYAWTN